MLDIPGYLPGYLQSTSRVSNRVPLPAYTSTDASRVPTRKFLEYLPGYIQTIYPEYLLAYLQRIYPDTPRVSTQIHPQYPEYLLAKYYTYVYAPSYFGVRFQCRKSLRQRRHLDHRCRCRWTEPSAPPPSVAYPSAPWKASSAHNVRKVGINISCRSSSGASPRRVGARLRFRACP